MSENVNIEYEATVSSQNLNMLTCYNSQKWILDWNLEII